MTRQEKEVAREPVNGLGSLIRLVRHLQSINCQFRNYGVILFAGDNGISRERTSRYEPMASSQIVISHLRGLAPTSILLKRIGHPEFVVDVGLYNQIDDPALLAFNIKRGTRSFLEGDALTPAEVEQALEVGGLLGKTITSHRFDIIGIGEIGIGDTLCAAAIASVITGRNPKDMTGRGSSDYKVITKKSDIIIKALDERYPQNDIIDVLSRFGGLEIAAITGFILEAAARRIPVMLDGYVTAVAALLASGLDKKVSRYLVAPNLSREQGHRLILQQLNIEPVFKLDINYGEGLVAAMGLFLAELMAESINSFTGTESIFNPDFSTGDNKNGGQDF